MEVQLWFKGCLEYPFLGKEIFRSEIWLWICWRWFNRGWLEESHLCSSQRCISQFCISELCISELCIYQLCISELCGGQFEVRDLGLNVLAMVVGWLEGSRLCHSWQSGKGSRTKGFLWSLPMIVAEEIDQPFSQTKSHRWELLEWPPPPPPPSSSSILSFSSFSTSFSSSSFFSP